MSSDIPFIMVDLDVPHNSHARRKASDVLTNLGLRLGRKFVQTDVAVHQIRYTTNKWTWLIAGMPSERLTTAFQAAIDIFDFKHLEPDPEFPRRPKLVGYDPRHVFLDEIFTKMGADLIGPKASNKADAKPKIIVQITHDVDNPQLLTLYQLVRSFALLLCGRWVEFVMLKAAARALLTWSKGRVPLEAVDPFWCFDKINVLAQKYGFRSTFFVHAQYPKPHARDPKYKLSNPQYQKLLRKLASQGHEIGLHSGINFNDFLSTRETFLNDPVRSHRAHYWAAPPNDLEHWYDTMARSGLIGDASMNPKLTGYAFGSLYPVLFTTQSDRKIVIHPSQFMDAYHVKERAECRILETIRNVCMSSVGIPSSVRPVVSLNWHVRTFSGIGPWASYDNNFISLLETIINCFDVTFNTVEQSSCDFMNAINEFKYSS